MSYIEEFCEEIALIDKGEMVLLGNLNDIKRDFGKNRLVLKLSQLPSVASDILTRDFKDLVKHHEIKKDRVILELHDHEQKHAFMARLSEKKLDVELFSIYQPSLEDIFIESVGE